MWRIKFKLSKIKLHRCMTLQVPHSYMWLVVILLKSVEHISITTESSNTALRATGFPNHT